jgi:hypothetical protein
VKANISTGWLLGAISFSVAAIFSWVDMGLYLSKTAHDGTGIGLYAAAAVFFTIASAGFFIQWHKVRRKPEE